MPESVQKQQTSNGKKLGGCTGKGFMPGKSGNPGGRRKGKSLLSVIREIMDEQNGERRELAAQAFVDALIGGSFNHAKELIEREEGKLPDDGTVKVIIEYADAQPRNSAEDETATRRAVASN